MINPYQHHHQTTFVDTTEFGLIDIHSVRRVKAQFKSLSDKNQTLIKNRFCFKYELKYHDFERLMDEQTHFRADQFYDFRESVGHYGNTEKYPD
jgi:hypothetical protein